MPRRLSVIRHRYNAAQVLSEILRDELTDSDNSDDCDEFFDSSSESEVDVVEEDNVVADELEVVDSSVAADVGVSDEDDTTATAERSDNTAIGADDVSVNNDDVIDNDNSARQPSPDANSGNDENDVDHSISSANAGDSSGNGSEQGDDCRVVWSRCGTIAWRSKPPILSRQPARNVLTETSGLAPGLSFNSVADAFKVFVGDDMMQHILAWTNRHADDIKEKSPNFRWIALEADEFYAFIGLSLLAGVQKSQNQRLMELWDDQWGYPIFPATMSFQRYTNIMRALRFDDKSTRATRVQSTGNQAAAVQEMMDMFVDKCRTAYKCGPSVTIDEQLVTFHGRCRFRMYIPTKPGKYGLKVWVMADSDTYYCADAQLYAGKVGNQPDVGQASRVVLQLSDSIAGSGRNITTDNFFTS